ncbi:hypothetical protein [Allostreptomyces psammosilenae]|uniref:Uncharacterized protein n=1 Tax=Allostreptomyces psammosilenae TaxID=1892865 RepID=A0A852ZPZ0_9ACTN|nr:hypothetical protein [Allostreptomyces psammosilenae]NYI04439.1 hypothetical protein [Allostreptomyces psammosilenae]
MSNSTDTEGSRSEERSATPVYDALVAEKGVPHLPPIDVEMTPWYPERALTERLQQRAAAAPQPAPQGMRPHGPAAPGHPAPGAPAGPRSAGPTGQPGIPGPRRPGDDRPGGPRRPLGAQPQRTPAAGPAPRPAGGPATGGADRGEPRRRPLGTGVDGAPNGQRAAGPDDSDLTSTRPFQVAF